MKTVVLFISFIITSTIINAQSWCTPGSTWYYVIGTMSSTIHQKQTYQYDTIIDGSICNKIQCLNYIQSLMPDHITVGYYYTKLENGIVYKNNGTINVPKFDTLYNFNASIGDKWRCMPDFDQSCSMSYLEVTDTGRVNIQGQSLKWLKIYYENHFMEPNNPQIVSGTDTIFERMGTKKSIYTSGDFCFDGTDWATSQFRCFTDNQININSTSLPCGYLTNNTENESRIEILQIQNPVNDKIIGKSTNKIYDLKLNDALGKMLYKNEYPDDEFSINVSIFESGIYFLQMSSSNGEVRRKKILIQH